MSRIEIFTAAIGIVFTMIGIMVLCIYIMRDISGLAIGTMLSVGIISLWASLSERLNHMCDICGKKE